MIELTIPLDNALSKPLYEQIYEYIRNEIQNGGLPFHERLPSTRNLAKFLSVSRSTVELAYEQLLSEGYIEAIPCKGFYVNELEGLYHLKVQKTEEASEDRQTSSACVYDFSPHGVDLNSFPHNAWRKISKNILMEDNKEFFRLGEAKGELTLRQTIASYLHQARGVNCSPSRIIVGAGTDYILMLLCVLLGREHQIAMESPTYKKAYDVLKTLSNEMLLVDMDEEGMRVEELEKTNADIAYVMPSHHFPLGTVMPMRRRMQLLKWANEKPGRFIIEDDYDSEFRYKGKPIPALQGYDSEGKVIYLGTFSKSIAPAIRISYMVLPESLMEQYAKIGKLFSSTVSRVDQMIVAAFLKEGYYERHLNKMRAIYKNRHDVLLEELKELHEICEITGENAGVHILLHFHNGMKEKRIMELAEKAGVKVYPLSAYEIGTSVSTKDATVILGYANLSEEEILQAVQILKKVWKTAER